MEQNLYMKLCNVNKSSEVIYLMPEFIPSTGRVSHSHEKDILSIWEILPNCYKALEP